MSDRPIVIAHRGASGYLPEHTLEAKALAYGLGSDYLEQDVVATRDGQLVVLHDLYLDDVTDVAQRFPGRQRADGRHYVIDFDLAELDELTVTERRRSGSAMARFPDRFPPSAHSRFRIASLDGELDLIAGLNRVTRRNVGIYAEIKHPAWHREHGIDLARLMLESFAAHGFGSAGSKVFVQCFDAPELQRVAEELGCKLPLVQLVGAEPEYAELLTDRGLAGVAKYAAGLGPAYAQLIEGGTEAGRPVPGRLAAAAHDAGLLLHPYTFRRDELPPFAANFESLLELFFEEVGVDGVFCDHPDVAVRVRDALLRERTVP